MMNLAWAHGQAHLKCEIAMSPIHSSKLERCDYSDSKILIRLTTLRAKNANTEVNALFKIKRETGREHPIWDRIWVGRGEGRLTEEEQADLRRLELDPPPLFAGAGTQAFLRLLGSFLEPNTAIENFDLTTDGDLGIQTRARNGEWGENTFGRWTPICEWIGQLHTAVYFTNDDLTAPPKVSVWHVGEPATKCKGRCGWGCSQSLPQRNQNQYTQECFNHDVCHAEEGVQLGVCARAFWAAATSYIFAPDCF